jgi:quinohemoprotein ethanol dehydrogenase
MSRKLILILVAAAVVGSIVIFMRPDSDPVTGADPAAGQADNTASHPAQAATAATSATAVDDKRIENAGSEPGNWLTGGQSFEGHRFSQLTQVNRANVAELGLAWARDMGTNHAQESTPIVVDGRMYTTSDWGRTYAFEVDSGELLWSFDPQVAGEYLRRACCGPVNRGAAVYQGKVYVGSLDGRLHALDAETGKKVWEVDTIIDRSRDYSSTGAPLAARGKIYIGNGGAEMGVRGYVSAYDAETGELVWRFYTVPGDPSQPYEHPEMELAAKTWTGDHYWKNGGGGTVWNSIVYDPDFNQVYIGVGNGGNWTRAIRSPDGGDNLFLSSIVAVDADTGSMNWYYTWKWTGKCARYCCKPRKMDSSMYWIDPMASYCGPIPMPL